MLAIEQLAGLRGEIARRDKLKREVADAEKYIVRFQEIKTLRERLTDASARIRVLRAHHVEVGRLRDPSAALQSLRNYAARLVENAAESGRDHGTAKKVFGTFTEHVEGAAKAAVDRVISSVPSVDESFLRQVEHNPSYVQQVAGIRSARDQLRREAPSASSDPQTIESFLKKLDELRRLADQLNPADFPQEVLEFFKAARQGGALLDKFTDTVREWLQQRGQLDRVRVIITS